MRMDNVCKHGVEFKMAMKANTLPSRATLSRVQCVVMS